MEQGVKRREDRGLKRTGVLGGTFSMSHNEHIHSTTAHSQIDKWKIGDSRH
jgi:hypothetical protein